jgi:hypothetical protein
MQSACGSFQNIVRCISTVDVLLALEEQEQFYLVKLLWHWTSIPTQEVINLSGP